MIIIKKIIKGCKNLEQGFSIFDVRDSVGTHKKQPQKRGRLFGTFSRFEVLKG